MSDAARVPYPSGVADRCLSFVVDELQPLIADRYPVGPSSTYVGHSFGGLFGAFTLLERPQTFDRYMLASPWRSQSSLGVYTVALVRWLSRADATLTEGGHMATLLWILAAILVIAGIVTLIRGAILLGIVLIIVGLLVGPGGVSIFT